MKLLCSVGRKKTGAMIPPKKKQKKTLTSLSRIKKTNKKKELNNILNITISVGYFYFHVLMFLCVLFYCTEILYHVKCSTKRASIHRTEPRQNPEEFVKRVSHHTIRCNWRYLHCSILLQISIYIQENEWLYVWICVLVLKKQHAARFFYRIWIHLISLWRQWTSSTLKNSWHPCLDD